uniref:SNRNP25 ubiquitin-like domain-containing protein n=1 Tax=Leptobrachium leishanense TaxID=445787 RepID=A0A8C5Q850_9ANUR
MDENDAVQYNLENDLNLEDVDEILPHAEITDIFQEGLAMLVQDPLLCDLPIQVTLEEINSQIALEFGQAMTVKICKASGEVMPVVIVQNATVLDLKRAIQRYIQLKHQREGGIQHISCLMNAARLHFPAGSTGSVPRLPPLALRSPLLAVLVSEVSC